MKLNLLDLPVFYINRSIEPYKQVDTEILLEECGFTNVTRIEGVENENSRFGCALSHLLAINKVPAPFIVFEDDCAVKAFRSELEVPDNADALYLGNMMYSWTDWIWGTNLSYDKMDGYEDIYRIYNMLGCHAVVYLTDEYVKASSYAISSAVTSQKHPHDLNIAELQPIFKVYSTGDPMFYQVGIHQNATFKNITEYPVVS